MHGARHIALLGRRPDTTSEAVREIESLGARIIPLAGDIADETRDARAGSPSRDAGATSARDRPCRCRCQRRANSSTDHRPDSRMLRPKIEGTVVLERVTQNVQLDFLSCFLRRPPS